MDAPDPQPWGLGLRTRMKAPPPSFIVFFPARDHPTFLDGNATTLVGTPQMNISWYCSLVAPKPISRLPAWHRVPTEAYPGKDGARSTRIIMRRIFHSDPRLRKKPIQAQAVCAEVSAAEEAAKWIKADQLELPNAKLRKTMSYEPSDAQYESFGAPQSVAEMASLYLEAKVDIVNGLMQIPRELLQKEVQELRSLKRTRGVAPMKRSLDKYNCIEEHGLYGGYRINSYEQLMPIIRKAAEFGETSIDLTSACIAEISANFVRIGRHNPRRRISLQGIPRLPVVLDAPEPIKSEVSLVLPHAGSTPDAKSPTKKSPKLANPLKATPRRLSDTVVKLTPAATPHIEPSPTKSPATPSTPFITTPRLSSPHFVNPLQQNKAEGNPELGLVASIPASTPVMSSPSFHPTIPSDISQIEFGPITPTFESSRWLNSNVAAMTKRPIKKTSRRKSEPLIRNCFKEQAARRRSASPHHLVFQGDVTFNTPESAKKTVVRGHTPDQLDSSEPTLSMMTPAISWGKMTGRKSGDGVQSTPIQSRALPLNGVYTVDMQQNPDIFRAPAKPSEPSPTAAVDILAGIAQGRCDDQAKVLVTEENGRLVVRFKLPTEYAYKFPNSQGVDESRFTVTPSIISSSPRITFDSHQLNTAEDIELAPTTPEVKPDDDSPGRDYMIAFIKRTSKKRLSTTESGSPIANPLKRTPLGVKSSNPTSPLKSPLRSPLRSPLKSKRKAVSDSPSFGTQTTKATEPVLKKPRRADKPSSQKQDSDGTVNPLCTRRSTRLRSQKHAPPSKSSIPTAIKLGARTGSGRGDLNSTTRSQQQDVSNQTRMNTRKNKGNAEYPAQVLAKYHEERLRESSDGSSEGSTESDKGRKRVVGWKTPLEVRQEKKPKRAQRVTRASARVRA
ncbi:hypothetical protein QQS21_009666 [Conoideocrella luteorostrata]|uniref:Uncharacterized protein n=1 Tax=Conoideocrella luteorostrata TaxID=1105319 RepID=A0AAJ0CJ84_9HYPO|nr:hypothetical protein QQS21_009666 [Conoideocrella luteorostrata]